MLNNLEPFSNTPSKQEFATTFRLVSKISFWVQLVLGLISGIAVLLAYFSRNITTQTNNAGYVRHDWRSCSLQLHNGAVLL